MIKIKSIKFYNHEIFGSKKFDFTNKETTSNVVILAGENGSGKTRLLEEINNACNYNYQVINYGVNEDNLACIIELDLTNERYHNKNNPKEKVDSAMLYQINRRNIQSVSYEILFKK